MFIKKEIPIHNLEQNICRLFHVLTKFPFTTSETEIDYQYQTVTVRNVTRLHTWDLRNLGNFKEIPEMSEISNE